MSRSRPVPWSTSSSGALTRTVCGSFQFVVEKARVSPEVNEVAASGPSTSSPAGAVTVTATAPEGLVASATV